ncbi:TonB-dependent receptor [Pseudodesulfovibrio sp. S3]|uniref:TonB-dependent receptor n=1 Tax=unclassified Pseudodesulfovibrio TaxID=2661612 RepID=UPI0013E36C7E|nr:TonB-dependent receptor [Pseudodesulfovibrio sp. S3]MCJ2163394.1 TonB-dependent receptor [Pseudodesulfovibrio sp. S3-i]
MDNSSRLSKTGGLQVFLLYGVTAVLLSVFALAVLPAGALASEEKESETGVVKLEAVKVTANKMEEDPMDVPQSITVIDEVEIQEKGIKSVADIIDTVPGMSFSKDHGIAVNFRGLNASMFTQNNPVTLFVDGVGYSGRYGFDTSLVNVERVEVLRGAQSTLYGKDAMGAVINVVTKDPTNEWLGKAGAEYGSMNYMKGFASANGPLVEDMLFLGFSAQYDRDQGWIKNDYPGMEEDANRERDKRLNGYILYTPNDDLRVRFAVQHNREKTYWGDEYAMPVGSSLDSFDADDAKHISYDVDTWTKTDNDAQSLRVEYAFNSFKLDSISTHRSQEIEGVYDSDHGDDPAYAGLIMYDNGETDSWGQEFRFSSVATTGFRWMCGIYADMEEFKKGPYGQQVAGAPAMDMDAHSRQHSRTKAAFGQVMVPLGESFELTLGSRFQSIHKDIDLKMYMNPVGAPPALFYSMNTDKTWNVLLPKAALSYSINDNWTSYLSYTHGYMPGGFNDFAMGGSDEDNTFEPEKSVSYEWGVKAGYDKFRMSAALFYMDIEDIHVYKTVGTMYVTDNAKKAHSQGFEFEATYMPTDTLELSGSFSIIKAKYDDYDTGTKKFDGEDIEQTPSHSVRLSAAYHDPSGFYTRADGRYFGSRSFQDNASASFTKADPYAVVDGKVGYRFSDFDVYAYVDNITNEKYVTAFRSNSMASIAGVSEPRTFGLGVLYNF